MQHLSSKDLSFIHKDLFLDLPYIKCVAINQFVKLRFLLYNIIVGNKDKNRESHQYIRPKIPSYVLGLSPCSSFN